MTSKASTPEAEAVLNHGSGESGNESRSNFENSRQNLEESQPTEEDLCLPINNGSNLLSKNKNSTSDNSLTKGSVGLLRNEKDNEIYYSENNDYSLPNSKKSKNKLSFVGKTGGGRRKNYDRSNWECENKIREKFGLTHSGFLAGLFLICVAALLLIVVIVLSATWPQIPHRQKFPICVKSTCLRSSALILSKLNKTKPPCEDFYEFTCGTWTKKHSKPPPTRSKWGLEEEMDLKLSETVREVISVLPHQTRTNSLTWKIKNFYDSCMSLDNIETDNERPIRKIINELGGWNVLRNFEFLSWEFSKTLVKLHEEYGVTPFFSVAVVADPRNATKNVIKISSSGLGLPDRSYYYREKDDRISSSYCRYMKDVARQLGATSIDAHSFSEDMFYFEKRIAEATPSAADLEDVRNHQIHTLSALKTLAPSVPLHEILDAMFDKANINDNTEVLLSSTAYFIKISNIISTTDRSALNNYVIWNLVKEYLPYLSQNFQNIYSVYNRETTGAPNLIERWEFCVRTLRKFMDVGLAAQIEKSDFRTDIETNNRIVGEIFESIRRVIRESITKARWIDLDLYKHYVSKLNNATVQVGFPEAYLNSSYLEEFYSKLYVQKNNFFQNILYGISYQQGEKRRSYVVPKEEYRWLSAIGSNSKVTFIPSVNKIIVPQRLLKKPYYEPEYPLPVLYGTVGVQISRELISSLLKYSGFYFANGTLVPERSLLANLTLTSIDHQLKCLIDLSVENEIVTRERANKTSLKTFVEVSAIKQALKALKSVSAEKEHIHQAGLEDFDDESLFYIAYGQSLFALKTPQERDKDDTVGTALDGKELMKVVKVQLKTFAEAFDCSQPKNPCKHLL